MRSAALVLGLAASSVLAVPQSSSQPVTGQLGDATVVSTNPVGVTYLATLPDSKQVKGSVTGVSTNGTGVTFSVNFSNLPTSGGPFLYHIHDAPVPADGNCTGTLAHLDPFIRGEQPPCDASRPQSCQVGDLSGKYGKITSDPFTATYTDLYASTQQGLGAFFGNRSITVHYANTTRITCASFALVSSGSGNGTVAPGSPSAPASSTVPFSGGAGRVGASAAAMIVGAAAVAALL